MSAVEQHDLASRLGPFWTRKKLTEALARVDRPFSPESATTSVLGVVTSDDATLYPVSQFRRVDGVIEVKPGVGTILSILGDEDPWAVALFLTTPSPELDGRTPLDLADSDDEHVLGRLTALARRVLHEWSA